METSKNRLLRRSFLFQCCVFIGLALQNKSNRSKLSPVEIIEKSLSSRDSFKECYKNKESLDITVTNKQGICIDFGLVISWWCILVIQGPIIYCTEEHYDAEYFYLNSNCHI